MLFEQSSKCNPLVPNYHIFTLVKLVRRFSTFVLSNSLNFYPMALRNSLAVPCRHTTKDGVRCRPFNNHYAKVISSFPLFQFCLGTWRAIISENNRFVFQQTHTKVHQPTANSVRSPFLSFGPFRVPIADKWLEVAVWHVNRAMA